MIDDGHCQRERSSNHGASLNSQKLPATQIRKPTPSPFNLLEIVSRKETGLSILGYDVIRVFKFQGHYRFLTSTAAVALSQFKDYRQLPKATESDSDVNRLRLVTYPKGIVSLTNILDDCSPF